jgi:hypothetical protein
MLLSLFTAILLQNFEGGEEEEDEDDPNTPVRMIKYAVCEEMTKN